MRWITLPQGHESNLEVTWAVPGLAIFGLTDSYIPSALFFVDGKIPRAKALALLSSLHNLISRDRNASQRLS